MNRNGVLSQRKHPRRVVDLWAIEQGDGFTSWHHVRNLSPDGIFFEASTPLAQGTPLTLEIELPGGRKLHASAAVVHATASDRETGIGARILDIAPNGREVLESFLAAT